MKSKGIKILTLFLFSAFLVSCGGESAKEAKVSEKKEKAKGSKESITYKVNTKKSQLNWTGRKMSGKHEGTLDIKSGILKAKGGKLQAGEFVADMTTIEVLDSMEEKYYNKLMNHLRSPDFFSVDSFPESSFELTGVKKIDKDTAYKEATHHISGNLTIKGTTKNVSEIPAKIEVMDDKVKAHAVFSFDRTKWGIMYKSKSVLDNLKDGYIYDQVDLEIDLVAAKKKKKESA